MAYPRDKNKRSRTPDALTDVLSSYFTNAGFAADFADYFRILRAWPAAVGAVIAGRSMPASLSKGLLVITVRDSVWANELSLLKEDLKKKIRAVCGVQVNDIRTRIGEVEDAPPPQETPKPKKKPMTGTPEWVEHAVTASGITDDALRERFRKTLLAHAENEDETE